jgi:hypothetical protein
VCSSDLRRREVLGQGEPALETTARWDWRYLAGHVQRSIFDDQKNNGEFRIKPYVNKRLTDMRDGLEQDIEEAFFQGTVTGEGGKLIQGLYDIVTSAADQSTGTYGGIARPLTYDAATEGVVSEPLTGNTFWGPKFLNGTTPKEVNLLEDMKKLYNGIFKNKQAPDLIISDRGLFEMYESFALDISQIIKETDTRMADLGFDVLRFKGKRMIWSDDATTDDMLMVNTEHIKVTYDPQLWFEMTEFKPIPLQGERIAHILLAMNTISGQLRRHGRLYYS